MNGILGDASEIIRKSLAYLLPEGGDKILIFFLKKLMIYAPLHVWRLDKRYFFFVYVN